MRTHPLFVGIANALIPGAGYLILKERIVFGALLLGGTLALVLLMVVEPQFVPSGILTATSAFGMALEVLWYTLFTAAYGVDAYLLAREKQPVVTQSLTSSSESAS